MECRSEEDERAERGGRRQEGGERRQRKTGQREKGAVRRGLREKGAVREGGKEGEAAGRASQALQRVRGRKWRKREEADRESAHLGTAKINELET